MSTSQGSVQGQTSSIKVSDIAFGVVSETAIAQRAAVQDRATAR
jgi:hypothetical protein